MSLSTSQVCFNSSCNSASDKWFKGWRCQTGDYAHLCNRCSIAYEEGRFCETFHLNASGWRCCQSCRKQIHCGCIVSFHMFVLLDAGGIECLACTQRSYVLTPNHAWPPLSHSFFSNPERMNDLSIKPWSALAGSGPVHWHQAPSVFNGHSLQSIGQPMTPSVIDRSHIHERLADVSSETKPENSYGEPGFGPFETLLNGFTLEAFSQKNQFYPSVNGLQPTFPKKDSGNSNLASISSCNTWRGDTSAVTVSIQQEKNVCCNNGKPPGGGLGCQKMRRKYCPQIIDKELQQIAINSTSVITPLFEKRLTASDVARIGRLVLPKKCAEAYFPPIAHTEKLALQAQEMNGKEWVFQYRFWPRIYSRVYVLEGVFPFIQSMQLQAGDAVTFGRLEPGGKLVIGCRKASIIPSSNQENEGTAAPSGTLIPSDHGSIKLGDVIHVNSTVKSKPPKGKYAINQAANTDIGTTRPEVDKCGVLASNVHEPVSVIHCKRNNGQLGAKCKRLKIEHEDSLELNLTCKEVQRLMRQPDGTVPSVSVVEGWEFEDFEDEPPVIGRPTIFWTDNFGEKNQWAQCEDCFKWRKVPVSALLPSRWICPNNVWDHNRSVCSTAEELTKDQLEDMLRSADEVSSEEETTEQDTNMFVALEGLDTLSNLAIQDEEETNMKHPGHKLGCVCITCHQSPSGKGLKHEQSCDCVVCSSMKNHFMTLMDRCDKKHVDREAEFPSHTLQLQQLPKNANNCSVSPLKDPIDLNLYSGLVQNPFP